MPDKDGKIWWLIIDEADSRKRVEITQEEVTRMCEKYLEKYPESLKIIKGAKTWNVRTPLIKITLWERIKSFFRRKK